MEKHYEKALKENYCQSQVEPSIPSQECSFKNKENLFKEIYSNIALFRKLVYEARKEK